MSKRIPRGKRAEGMRAHRRGQSEAKKVGARAKAGPMCIDVLVFIDALVFIEDSSRRER